MSIALQLQRVSKSFGPRRLFSEATVSLAEGQRVGFIGANGAGKTTLVRMILGEELIDHGAIMLHPNVRLGYLEQHEQIDPREPLLEYLMRVSGREEWECAKAAAAFELTPNDLAQPFGSFSGGYQMRVRLTGVMVREPNLLLLDEPTNYLDLQTVLLLEEVLRAYKGALLLISHDREFLKNVCTHTLELSHGKLTLYPGDVEAYLAHKEHLQKEAERYNQKIDDQRAHIQKFVDRFRASSAKAVQVQSRLRVLEKLAPIEIAHRLRTARIHIESPAYKKGTALTLQNVTVGYGTKAVLHGVSFSIERGDHVAVLGENGQGKSTLLKTIAEELVPLEGICKWGHRLRVGYYAQHVPAMLPKYGSAGQYLTSVAGEVLPEELLRMAGNFLFTKDDLEKPISILSGGERARLCLAALCLGKYDVLILDEPTNHLDFSTVEALGEALQEYTGTVIFVSHSRTFVSQIATTILEVKNGTVRRYPYPYDVYVYELKTHERVELPVESTEGGDQVDGEVPYVRCKTDVYHDMQKEKRLLERLEREMKQLLAEREKIFATYTANPTNRDVSLAKRLKEIEASSLAQEDAWFQAQDRLEMLEREMRTAKEEYG